MDGVSDFKQFLNFGESVTLMHLFLKKKKWVLILQSVSITFLFSAAA